MKIKQKIKTNITRLIPSFIKNEIKKSFEKSLQFLINPNNKAANFINVSFSQEGEDLILSKLIGRKKKGFYVDIGAHHPFRFSNTYKFYLSGWRGINVDAFPGSMQIFNQYRPDDINLETAILNDNSRDLVYYIFEEQAFNTFDEQSAKKIEAIPLPVKEKIHMKPTRLKDILDSYLEQDQCIDFFTIDVEGMDLEVLRSNDWLKYRPNYIIAESRLTRLKEDFDSDLTNYLSSKNYELIARAVNSVFYRSK